MLSMQVSDLVTQATAVLSSYMAAIASQGIDAARRVAAEALSQMVAERLRLDGHGSAWDAFARDQQNDSVVQYLLQQSSVKDDNFREKLQDAVMRASSEGNGIGQQTVNATGASGVQVGDTVAIGQGTYHKGDSYNSTNSRTTVKRSANPMVVVGGVAVAAVLALTLIINLLGALQGGSLTADSTCRQFLNTDQQTEEQAIVNIAVAKGLGGFGSPLALPAVRYDCSSNPDAKLGDVIQRLKGQF
jgi:hypothetical protein